jgi:hypothetical protein
MLRVVSSAATWHAPAESLGREACVRTAARVTPNPTCQIGVGSAAGRITEVGLRRDIFPDWFVHVRGVGWGREVTLCDDGDAATAGGVKDLDVISRRHGPIDQRESGGLARHPRKPRFGLKYFY